jgi:putative flippase GtrA
MIPKYVFQCDNCDIFMTISETCDSCEDFFSKISGEYTSVGVTYRYDLEWTFTESSSPKFRKLVPRKVKN